MRSKKNEGAFGKNAGPLESALPAFPGETNAFAFALHLYRFSHGQSYFSFSKKIYGSKRGVHVLSTPLLTLCGALSCVITMATPNPWNLTSYTSDKYTFVEPRKKTQQNKI